ncbi:MAG: hypothetical protein FJW54_06355 [Actinobacteria bacterium]|nr:hypothetical protein [Actinomycetota bacterium]
MKRWVALFSLIFASLSFPTQANEAYSATSTSVSFGASFPMTGAASPGIGSYYAGIEAYFSYVNENGGIYNRKINLVKKDDMNTTVRAIANNNSLILNENVFALISTSPSCANQLKVSETLNLSSRGVPNLFVDCYIEKTTETSDLDSVENLSTTYYGQLSLENQMLLLKSHIDKYYPNRKIAIVHQDDDHSLGIAKIKSSSPAICLKSFLAGLERFIGAVEGFCRDGSKLQNGDVILYSGGPAGLAYLVASSEKWSIKTIFYANDDALNQSFLSATGLPLGKSAEIFSISSNRLISEKNDPTVEKLISIGEKYAGTVKIDQRFIEGMNAGYIIGSVLAAVGPDLTRERFMKVLDLYGADSDVLGVSDRSKDPATRFMPLGGVLVRTMGSTSEAISDVMTLTSNSLTLKPRKLSSLTLDALPVQVQRLPNTTPTVSPSPTPMPTVDKTPEPKKSASPPPSASPILDIEGDEEVPFGKIGVKKDKNRYTISISSNLPEENLQVRATKKGQKSINFSVVTDEDGQAKFTTSRNLAGFRLALSLDGEILTSIRVN